MPTRPTHPTHVVSARYAFAKVEEILDYDRSIKYVDRVLVRFAKIDRPRWVPIHDLFLVYTDRFLDPTMKG